MSRSKYTINENYFDVIDTEEKAYWIGFIWCDGYVRRRERPNRSIEYTFYLALQKGDYNHLVKFNESLNSDYLIKKEKYGRQAKSKDEYYYRLGIYKKNFVYKLYHRYGLIVDRTDVTRLISKIPFNLYRHFIRGVLDADGSMTIYDTGRAKDKQRAISITFSTYHDLLKDINKHLIEAEFLQTELKLDRRHKESNADCFGLQISGNKQAVDVLKYLYKDSHIYLDRKYDKANCIFKEDEKHRMAT